MSAKQLKKYYKDLKLGKLKEKLNTYTSQDDIIFYMRQYAPNNSNDYVKQRIKLYKDLANYSNINELLPNDYDYCFVLTVWEKEGNTNVGHWCVLTKYNKGKTIEWFDSLKNGAPDSELKYVEKDIADDLGEDVKYLSLLLNTANDEQEIIYNDVALQSDKWATCGRWSICRAVTASIFNWDLERFLDMINETIDEQGLVDPDVAIVELIP